jgi:hypothetical protein
MLLALIVRAKNLGASPSIIGVMLALSGGGALLGSAFAPELVAAARPGI